MAMGDVMVHCELEFPEAGAVDGTMSEPRKDPLASSRTPLVLHSTHVGAVSEGEDVCR